MCGTMCGTLYTFDWPMHIWQQKNGYVMVVSYMSCFKLQDPARKKALPDKTAACVIFCSWVLQVDCSSKTYFDAIKVFMKHGQCSSKVNLHAKVTEYIQLLSIEEGLSYAYNNSYRKQEVVCG